MNFALPQNAIYLVLTLLLSSSLAANNAEDIYPLEPYIQNSPLRAATGDELQRREPTIIGGLLQIRQSCARGYGLCENGRCCRLGGKCCTSGCCNPGYWCYSTGCCSLNEMGCEQISCCPVGSNCCRGGGCCRPNYYCVVTSTRRGCCPNGRVCVGNGGILDDGDSGSDGGGGIPTDIPTTTTTTLRPTPTGAPDPPEISDFPNISTTPGSTSSLTASATPSRPSIPRPTASTGQIAVSYLVNDARITWSSGWITGSSTCSTSARKTTTAMESFTVMVTSGQRIYLNIDCTNADYDVYVDGDFRLFSGFDNTETCSYKQLQPAPGFTNINVTVVVIGVPRNGRRQTGGGLFDWSFQLNEVLVMDSSSSSGSTQPNSALGVGVSWFHGLAIALLASFGLIL